MTSPKPKAPASLSPAEGTPPSDSSSMPLGIAPPAKSSTKIKLQFKDKSFALPSLPEEAPVGNSSPMPTGIASPVTSSTKIKLQLKNKDFALPSLSEAPVGDSSSMLTETMPPAKKLKRSPEFTEGLNSLDAYRPSPTRLRGMRYFEQRAAESSSSTQAASASAFSSAHRAIMTTTKPSKIVILKLPPAKLLTISTSTQAASAGSSLKPTTSSSNLASFTNKASPLPIAATSDRVYSSRGRKLRKTYKAEEENPRSNVAAQGVAAQNAGQKRKAVVATTPAKKRVRFTNIDEAPNVDIAANTTSNKYLESAKTTKLHKSNVAQRTRIETGSRSRAKISRVKKAHQALREALSRAELVAWEEEKETIERGIREKMGKALRDWEALEKQRDLEAEQAN
ncbi:hypothetical protein BOTCAL_0052g00350 [Botryotinia calthae]|uniref:Uncharacterized protein n=1 Tax=Botryotinia calthae TaxID=38488 RepID=A0A4Y8DB06_9HELO|nr:hypothetical protein BOTCAL_0052g00350 [Botryotinia calthae]